MKRIVLIISLFTATCFKGNAQWSIPFVEWEPIPNQTVTLPEFEIPDLPVIAPRPSPSAPTVLKTELINADCYDFTRQEIIKTKVKAIQYSNGDNMLLLIGKKINDSWISMKEVHLLSIESLLSDAKSEQEKSNLLYLSETFHFIAIDEDENVYGF